MPNVSRLQKALADSGLPAMLVSEIESVRWLTGFTGSSAFVVLKPDGGVFITDSRYAQQGPEEVKDLPSAIFASPVEASDFIKSQAEALGVSKMGFEAGYVTYGAYQSWSSKLAPIELVPAPDLIGPLRMVKTPDELAKIREACKITDACFEHVIRMIQPGVSEWDVLMDIEFYFRRQGLELAYAPIVVSGDRSARPHGKPSNKAFEKGDFVTMDFGCKFEGYCADLTRTVIVGEATDRHREIYDLVLRGQLAALGYMKPGNTAKGADGLVREIFAEKGMDKYFGHGLGHGLGRVVHDAGRMNPTSETVFEPGQVWTVEPGIYVEGFGGCRIEDDVVITESGIENFTGATKEMLVLP